jgi:hypothetical protein
MLRDFSLYVRRIDNGVAVERPVDVVGFLACSSRDAFPPSVIQYVGTVFGNEHGMIRVPDACWTLGSCVLIPINDSVGARFPCVVIPSTKRERHEVEVDGGVAIKGQVTIDDAAAEGVDVEVDEGWVLDAGAGDRRERLHLLGAVSGPSGSFWIRGVPRRQEVRVAIVAHGRAKPLSGTMYAYDDEELVIALRSPQKPATIRLGRRMALSGDDYVVQMTLRLDVGPVRLVESQRRAGQSTVNVHPESWHDWKLTGDHAITVAEYDPSFGTELKVENARTGVIVFWDGDWKGGDITVE